MASKVVFTRESAQRIAKAVRKSEGLPSVPLGGRRMAPAGEGWRLLIGKTDASHAKGASGTISIWDGETQSSFSDTGENITAYNRFATVASGMWVGVKETVRGYELVCAEC